MEPYESDPAQTLSHLEEAERHVREGAGRVERQRELVARLQQGGHPTEEPEALLAQFDETLAAHIESLDRLREEARGMC
jgi:hypothetical protein